MFEFIKLLYYLLNPKTIFLRRASHGMGDNLLMSMLLPKLKGKYPKHSIIVETELPELYYNNPYVTWVTKKHFTTTKRHIRPKYKIDETTEVSLYEQLMSFIDVKEKAHPQLFLTDEEIDYSKKKFPFNYIVTCPVGKQSFTANRKEWGVQNFAQLRRLLGEFEFVQVGSKSDELLENVHDARGCNIRESAAIIKNSLFFIGLEGGLMHISKAVGSKAVILYGGFIKPKISGYEDFLNIYNQTHCSPCFHSHKPHTICETMICFDEITPEYVYNLMIEEGYIEK